ncbi:MULTISPECIES: RHS repeat-associated core domain-containing protein [unclassified Pseudomonas]|uniref:RHS repeat-associated core domain-containing protein n=1 Tax=unclassified Pseudomonas TaxID=196821 RepID=UPI000C87ED17|nr:MULTISPECIES: RHS repeat-associated core domain-containing protein [unclassified Pseudomonas]PMZ89969.1 sugar-binding protein [Pseudomonas sp. FW215-T2]PNA12509.1 sugar-binding protein [Pseudomonas sp. FW215-R3]
MSTSTAVHSNAFNFMSFILSQVDPRTGQYTCAISLPELKANNLCGPIVPLQLIFNPFNTPDSGFGKGWDLKLSQFNTTNRMLSLYTGESFKVNPGANGAEIPEKKIDSFHFHDLGNQRYRVEHKSGLVEILARVQGDIALPVQMRSPQGHSVSLDYVAFGTGPLLSSIRNADGTPLLTLVRNTNWLDITLFPGSAYEALFRMNIVGGETTSLILPTDDQASWRFGYVLKEGLTCLAQVDTPTGARETVTYSAKSHAFPGLASRKLPRVERHVRNPGFGQPAVEKRYEYDARDHNFLGYGSGVSWSDDGLDNLYKVSSTYWYETTEILWDGIGNQKVEETRRVFNHFHLQTLEETTQYSSDPSKHTLKRTDTEYHLVPNLEFKDQPPYCQLPKTVTETWHLVAATTPRHVETVSTTYDNFGNLLTQVNANGVTETSEWYKAEGEDGCPADPQGFVRNLKRKTVTPAKSDYGNAPTLQTRYTYSELPSLIDREKWLAIENETLMQIRTGNELELTTTTYAYFNDPGNPFEHGRKRLDEVAHKGNVTATHYSYRMARYARTDEPVLHTDIEIVGFDDSATKPVRKRHTLMHSMFNGEPLLNRDDSDVEIAYEYDLLSRVTKETVAPNTAYEASRSYTYRLTNAAGQQALQTACDVKGVTTTTWLDGFNRPIKEARQDADAPGFNPNDEPRLTYEATYNNREQLISETVIDWEGPKNVPLTSLLRYDDWGEQRCVVRADGVEEHEVTDPIHQTTTQWLEVEGKDATGKTVTANNLFDKPDSIKRYAKGVDPTAPGAVAYSEHLYRYDGMGRTAEEHDPMGNRTAYEYDAFDRMVKTVLPDYYEVEREYAPHSTEDLPTRISVGGIELGTQEFDGLDRMTASTTGGRRSEYTFDPGQSQPKSVLRPSGVTTDYVYRPELGEDPEQRIAVESTAVFTYDQQNARLRKTQEVDENGITHVLEREYFSTGELKSERRGAANEEPYVMHYQYSRQARLLNYIDVLGQHQTYTYNPRAQLIETRLGNTHSTFTYDDLARVKSIRTVDGDQVLETTIAYDDYGREVLRTFDFGQGVIQTLAQTYDEADRLTHRMLQQGSDLLRDETYAYDERGRLVDYRCEGSECPVDPYGKTIIGQLFGFDEKDNLTYLETTFDGGRHSIYFEYNNEDPCQLSALDNELSPPRPGDPDYPPRIDFNYDANGNLLNDEAGRLLGYDSLSRLISVSALSGESLGDYQYDALDILSGSGSDSGNERRFYQNGDLVNLVKGADSSTFVRAEGVVLAEHQEGASPKSLLLAADDKSSVLHELGHGERLDLAYTPYGYSVGGEGALGYNGEQREVRDGRYLLGKGYRALNSTLMRFESPDSLSPFGKGGMNGYAYVAGNPVGYTDPTGHLKLKLFALLMFSGVGEAGQAAGQGAARTSRSVLQGASRTAGQATNAASSTVGASDDLLSGFTMTTTRGSSTFGATTSVAQQTGSRGVSSISSAPVPSMPGPSRATPAVNYAPQQSRQAVAQTKPGPAIPAPKPPKPLSTKEFNKLGLFDRQRYLDRGGIDPTTGMPAPKKKSNWMDVPKESARFREQP